jgi:hypothetical protein
MGNIIGNRQQKLGELLLKIFKELERTNCTENMLENTIRNMWMFNMNMLEHDWEQMGSTKHKPSPSLVN